MSLTVREQQALEGMASRLARSDPGLATKLAMFTQLTSGEAMPARESTQLARGSARGARRLYRRLGLRGVAALVWLLITFALIGIAVAFSGGGKSNGACTTSWPVVCAARSASTPR
ncbi:MAG: hypothetical protein ACRDPY_27325 [Streptosporangiaceae bacterium]